MPLPKNQDFNANSAGLILSRPMGDFEQSDVKVQNSHRVVIVLYEVAEHCWPWKPNILPGPQHAEA